MRLFIGLATPEEVKQALERVTLRLRAKDDGLRWSTPDQWHVTLVFLGHVGDEACARVVDELGRVRLPPVDLRIDGLGVFERAGILYAQVEVTPALLRLYEAVVGAVRCAGLETEDRPYRAHVTLARSRNRDGKKTIERLRRSFAGAGEAVLSPAKKSGRELGARRGSSAQQRLNERWEAKEFLLYESKLSSTGSTYVVQERFGLVCESCRNEP